MTKRKQTTPPSPCSRKQGWKGLPLAHSYPRMKQAVKGRPFPVCSFSTAPILYYLSGGSWRCLGHPLMASPGPTTHSPTQLISSYHLLERTHNRFSVMQFTLTARGAKQLRCEQCSHFLVMQVHDTGYISYLENSAPDEVLPLLPLCI